VTHKNFIFIQRRIILLEIRITLSAKGLIWHPRAYQIKWVLLTKRESKDWKIFEGKITKTNYNFLNKVNKNEFILAYGH